MSTNPTPKHSEETAPDPEEDDLDDLDDVLDSFAAKPNASTTAPSTSGPGRPPPAPTSDSAILDPTDPTLSAGTDAAFATDLQSGMASLISELGENPEMQAQFEAMMAELVAAGEAPTQEEAIGHVKSASESMPLMPEDLKSGAAGDKKEGGKKEKEESFQDTIKKTMERMQASDTTAKTATTGSGSAEAGGTSEEQMLAELMKSLGGAGGSADGSGEEGGEEDFNTMLMSMMAQLTNKEILYEPMKELHEKFPAWMQAHEGTETEAEMGRYREQQRLVGEIVGRFERKGYSDGDEGDRAFIVERMQKMQAQGSPPPDLVGDMGAAQDALEGMDAGCPTQ
ncbi:Peroxisome chaperone and import receptor [Extremus antarcticus]|uniref:Peroxisome chaperone and import receptor n=1 Tax=Extremus antarcticus TaxID=702011 RepID=A0AAJ0G710_9PEZI|nr:Peroxisome chaperone and import receptor [Extremus antarcticus]